MITNHTNYNFTIPGYFSISAMFMPGHTGSTWVSGLRSRKSRSFQVAVIGFLSHLTFLLNHNSSNTNIISSQRYLVTLTETLWPRGWVTVNILTREAQTFTKLFANKVGDFKISNILSEPIVHFENRFTISNLLYNDSIE